MISLYLLNGMSTSSILTLVFTSLLLISLGMVSHDAFAMGAAPSTCPNRYDGSITSFIINNGTQTFDAVANPGVTFDVKRGSDYNVTFIIHTPNQSSQKNTDPGSTWYRDDAYAFGNGHCVYGGTTPSIGPDQDVPVNVTFDDQCTGCFDTQLVYFDTFVSDITFNVHWIPVPDAPTNLSANGTSSSQIEIRWDSSYSASPITDYKIYKSTNSGAETFFATVGNASSYNDTAVTDGVLYYYKVTAVNSAGESIQSNEVSATPVSTNGSDSTSGIVLNNVWSTSGTTSASNQITISNFNAESANNQLLLVGISANNNNVTSVTFGGIPLTRTAYSFYNNDAEFWYLKKPGGSGDIVVTFWGSTQVVVGAYSFSGVNQTDPIATVTKVHHLSASSPVISITTKYSNDVVLDLPSIWGGVTLDSPTCTSEWDVNVPNKITGASSLITVPTPSTVTCGWTASSADLWDDMAVEIQASGASSSTATATVPAAPSNLTATAISSSQINLSWTASSNNGGSPITGYQIQRSTDNGTTWSAVQPNTDSTATAYSDTGLAASTAYAYRVSAINTDGTGSPSNVTSATTQSDISFGYSNSTTIALNNVQSTSGITDSSNQITLSNFNTTEGNDRLLVVGVSANSNNVGSITFAGVPLTREVSHFTNNDAEFWYLTNPTGMGDITVTMNGPTQAVIGAYSFSGVNQTVPIPAHITRHSLTPSSPAISFTTSHSNDWVLDLPSIWGGVTLSSPTCTQQWNLNVPNQITGASSLTLVPSPASVTCSWTASSDNMWDDAAIEINAAR